MNPCKCECMQLLRLPHHFRLPIANAAAAKLKALVEEQVTRGRAVLYRQCCERLIFNMELHHAPEINGADDVDIVQKERFVRSGGIAQKKVTGFFQSATGVEQQLF